jgi:TonB family protein
MRSRMCMPAGVAMLHLLLLTALPAQGQEESASLVRPRLLSPRSASTELTKRYPASYEAVGATGVVRLRVRVDTAGRARAAEVLSSSGLARLDNAALSVLLAARFAPAKGPEGRVTDWVDVDLAFGDAAYAAGTAPPAVVNRDEVVNALPALYPASLRQEGVQVAVPFLLTVDASGRVITARSPDPGCFPEASEAAMSVARQLLFESAADGEQAARPTAVTITFRDSADILLRGDARVRVKTPEQTARDSARTVTAVRPELKNTRQVQRALVRSYPRDLRDKGEGGTVLIWFGIDEEGRVTKRQISESSGDCRFDRAGLDVAGIMRFSPALSDGEPTAVWVEVPIIFSSR